MNLIRITRIIGLIALIKGLTACNEDIDLIHPGEPLPVIYGILDTQDTIHNILLYKTFAGDSSLFDLMTQPDKLYYQNADITITTMSGNAMGPFIANDNIARQEGLFPDFPHRVYQLYHQLSPQTYHLTIETHEANETIEADFRLIDAFTVLSPIPASKTFYFYEDPNLFKWIPPVGAGVYEIAFSLDYTDFYKNGQSKGQVFRYAVVLQASDLEWDQYYFVYRYYSDPFFGHLGNTLTFEKDLDYRQPNALRIEITAADSLLGKYIGWNRLQIDGQNNPNGNIQNAIGIISSKYTYRYHAVKMSQRSQDSLTRGRYTGDLGFVANPDW